MFTPVDMSMESPRSSRRRVCALGVLSLFLGFSHTTAHTVVAQSNERSIPEIEWDTTLRKFQFDAEKFVGQRLTVRCPPLSVRETLETVYGTDAYPSDTPICVAALHAGMIAKKGGTVTIQLNPCEGEYKGSTQNGVTTVDLPETRRSIMFVDESSEKKADQIRLDYLPRLDWNDKFTGTGFAYRRLLGQQFTFRCPPAPKDKRLRLVFGTDSYDFSSMVCTAALHAGQITRTEGGIVTVQIDSGVPKLVGSIRNGVETKSKNGSDRSISFVSR